MSLTLVQRRQRREARLRRELDRLGDRVSINARLRRKNIYLALLASAKADVPRPLSNRGVIDLRRPSLPKA